MGWVVYLLGIPAVAMSVFGLAMLAWAALTLIARFVLGPAVDFIRRHPFDG